MNHLSSSKISCASSVFAKATLPRHFDAGRWLQLVGMAMASMAPEGLWIWCWIDALKSWKRSKIQSCKAEGDLICGPFVVHLWFMWQSVVEPCLLKAPPGWPPQIICASEDGTLESLDKVQMILGETLNPFGFWCWSRGKKAGQNLLQRGLLQEQTSKTQGFSMYICI